MRTSGFVQSAKGCKPHGHVCWAFHDRSEFRARASEYLADALAAGQWVEYVGRGSAQQVRDELRDLDGGQDAVRAGRAGATPVDDFYLFTDSDNVVDPVGSVAKRVAATDEAVAAGYPGFRTIVDCTEVASTPEQRVAFAQFEFLIDRTMSVSPASALCAYDTAELGSDAVAELACLHPQVSAGSTTFQLYADEGVEFALRGHVDVMNRHVFDTTLNRIMPLSERESKINVDGQQLEFIGHQDLLALNNYADAAGRTIRLRSPPHSASRTIELLDMRSLEVEASV